MLRYLEKKIIADGRKMTKFPVDFPDSREVAPETGSISTGTSATQTTYFGASGDFAEKSRHSVR
jgi:hypothetical protein